jgi:hypothetical protein
MFRVEQARHNVTAALFRGRHGAPDGACHPRSHYNDWISSWYSFTLSSLDDRIGSASASGGTYRSDGNAKATSSLAFTGTGVTWVTATGPAEGKASVTIDGVSMGTLDLYSPTVQWQVTKSYSGLTSGTHTIVVTVLGTKNGSSTGTTVTLDAFVVQS